jgi:hypothetical protein
LLSLCFRPVISSLLTAAIPCRPHFTQDGPDGDAAHITFRLLITVVVSLVFCFNAGAWYLIKNVSNHHIWAVSVLCFHICKLIVYKMFTNSRSFERWRKTNINENLGELCRRINLGVKELLSHLDHKHKRL